MGNPEVIDAQTFAGSSGFEPMRGMMGRRLPAATIGKLLAMRGGYAATLRDSTTTCAVQTTLPAGMGGTTTDLTITHLKAMTRRTRDDTARGEVISSGRRIATARGTLTEADGRIVATGTPTWPICAVEART